MAKLSSSQVFGHYSIGFNSSRAHLHGHSPLSLSAGSIVDWLLRNKVRLAYLAGRLAAWLDRYRRARTGAAAGATTSWLVGGSSAANSSQGWRRSQAKGAKHMMKLCVDKCCDKRGARIHNSIASGAAAEEADASIGRVFRRRFKAIFVRLEPPTRPHIRRQSGGERAAGHKSRPMLSEP